MRKLDTIFFALLCALGGQLNAAVTTQPPHPPGIRFAAAYAKQYQQPLLYNRVGWVDIPKVAEKVAADIQIARADGSLLVNTRMQGDSQGFRGTATSTDGGATWSAISQEKQLSCPRCQGSLIRYSPPDANGPGRLLFSNPRPKPGTGNDAKLPRVNLAVRTSTDDGRTWPVSKLLHEGPSAYSSLARLPDGTILCLYEGASRGEKSFRDSFRLARFNLEWLTGEQESSAPPHTDVKQETRETNDPTGENAWLAHGFSESQRTSLREAFRWGIENRFIPGGALLVIHRGEPVFREAFGVADLETGRPFTVGAPCRIASVTKPHTATLLAMLVEQGKLSWDDPLDKYLPRFAGTAVRGKGPAARSPKIRELLSHTAGFPNNTARRSGEWDVKANGTLAEVVDDMAHAGLAAEPGSVFAYTGLGYMVAGRVAEVVTGQEFAALMKERLLLPIGATTATFYSSASKELKARMPTMYERQDGRLVRADVTARGEGAVTFPNPGGGLISTLDDVGRFLMLHRNRGIVGGRRRIASESLDALYRPQPATGRDGYGLGFNILRTDAHGMGVRVRHTGASGTLVLLDFKQDLLVVLLTQVPTKQTQLFSNRLMKAIDSVFPPR